MDAAPDPLSGPAALPTARAFSAPPKTSKTYSDQTAVSYTYDPVSRLTQGEHSPAVLCQSIKPAQSEDGRIVQIISRSADADEDLIRRAELALRQPAVSQLTCRFDVQ